MKLEIPHVTICSVDPNEHREMKIMTAPTDARPNMSARRTEFILPPMDAKQGWSAVKVYDGVQFPALYEIGQAADAPATQPVPILARDTANYLVGKWQETSLSLRFPRGIMVIEEDIPTAVELRKLNEMATQRMRALVQAVDMAVNAGNNLDFVSRDHIDAANALGDVREWARVDRRQKKVCPRCSGIVDAAALGCTHCAIEFADFYGAEGYTLEEIKQIDTDVYTAMAAKKARLARIKFPTKG